MVEIEKPELAGETLRYRDNTWELTGTIEVKRNGETIHAKARRADRVRGDAGTLSFTLQDSTASLNPGNPGEFNVELEQLEDGQYLVVRRDHATTDYRLTSLQYD